MANITVEPRLRFAPIRALTETALRWLGEDFGYPASLNRMLRERMDVEVALDDFYPSIAADRVPAWHELVSVVGNGLRYLPPGTLRGWRDYGSSSYSCFSICRPEYATLGRCEVVDDWRCDISEVHGFGASKSNLSDFATTDQMAEACCPENISEISRQKLEENLSHKGIRVTRSPSADFFRRYAWDGRIFLINADGSHHFAAAKYIASRLGVQVPLRGKLHSYSMNAEAIASLQRDFEMFVISDSAEVSHAFHEAMASFRATWLSHSLPRPFDDAKAVLLPRDERRSMRVAQALRQAGIVDFGAYLSSLI
jgi:hypothetical protein